MNDTMSFFVHRLWKEYYVQKLKINKNSSVLDMAGGTGDIAFRVLDRFNRMPAGDGAITVADINEVSLLHKELYSIIQFLLLCAIFSYIKPK